MPLAGIKNQGGFLEGLAQAMGLLASLSILPDAASHVEFVNSIMAQIQGYLHHPDVGGLALNPSGQQAPELQGGGMQMPPTPNPDELRRMLGANAA